MFPFFIIPIVLGVTVLYLDCRVDEERRPDGSKFQTHVCEKFTTSPADRMRLPVPKR